jgi:hypothetical protein
MELKKTEKSINVLCAYQDKWNQHILKEITGRNRHTDIWYDMFLSLWNEACKPIIFVHQCLFILFEIIKPFHSGYSILRSAEVLSTRLPHHLKLSWWHLQFSSRYFSSSLWPLKYDRQNKLFFLSFIPFVYLSSYLFLLFPFPFLSFCPSSHSYLHI